MVPVKSFMVPKDKFITVERDIDVRTAGRLMRDRNIGSLFVTNGKEVIGIITDTDMVRRVVATGADTTKTTVEQIMSVRWPISRSVALGLEQLRPCRPTVCVLMSSPINSRRRGFWRFSTSARYGARVY